MIRSRHFFLSTFVMLVCLAATAASAGKYNTVLDIGDTAPAWSELPGTDDRVHSLETLEPKKVVVVAFTCNSCPYAVDAEDRLNALVDRYEGKSVAVVAINVNKVEEDRMPAMKQRAKEKGFKFAYLWDESQQIAKDYGAKYTPEFFVLDEDRKVVYMGAMDDSPAGDEVTKTYVIDAIEASLAGREVQVTETIPIGCRIRIERQRRTR
ncbi:thioredoxin family protein [Stieleria sp. ICT_E10.1]|uniref:thioredoxin family protein n=1 Tax=Stieleria sedimenti TaxID=2976331 RepID=UPI0021800E43|nr:thioredoxin family protein [Stieleria sedimenti]MCS7468753.1 thioredoxin family protein [Stieleria sedimenti]